MGTIVAGDTSACPVVYPNPGHASDRDEGSYILPAGKITDMPAGPVGLSPNAVAIPVGQGARYNRRATANQVPG